MPTFRERVNADGTISVQAIVRVKQAGVLVHSESQTFATRPLAEDWARRVQAKIKKEGVAARQRARSSLGDLIDKYEKARAEVKPLRRAMTHELDQLRGHVGDWDLSTLNAAKFSAFARARRTAGAGPATVLHNLATLRSVLNSAKPMFGIDVNGEAVSEAIKVLGKMGHVAKGTSRDRRVSDAEIQQLVAEFARIAGNPSTIIPMGTIVRLAVALPRRLGELTEMLWEDWDELKSVLVLRDTKHPTEPRTERIPVPPAAAAIIKALPVVDAKILPYKAESVSAAFQRACDRLKIEDLHLHDLRHEGICRLFEMSLAIPEVALISGHQSWAMLRRYTHLAPSDVIEKMNALSKT